MSILEQRVTLNVLEDENGGTLIQSEGQEYIKRLEEVIEESSGINGVIKEWDETILSLVKAISSLFRVGLRKSMTQIIFTTTPSFWSFVRDFSVPETVKMVRQLARTRPFFKNPTERDNAWIILSLNNGDLRAYLNLISRNEKTVKVFYSTSNGALLLDSYVMESIDELLGRLEAKKFDLSLDGYVEYLGKRQESPRTLSSKVPSVLSNNQSVEEKLHPPMSIIKVQAEQSEKSSISDNLPINGNSKTPPQSSLIISTKQSVLSEGEDSVFGGESTTGSTGMVIKREIESDDISDATLEYSTDNENLNRSDLSSQNTKSTTLNPNDSNIKDGLLMGPLVPLPQINGTLNSSIASNSPLGTASIILAEKISPIRSSRESYASIVLRSTISTPTLSETNSTIPIYKEFNPFLVTEEFSASPKSLKNQAAEEASLIPSPIPTTKRDQLYSDDFPKKMPDESSIGPIGENLIRLGTEELLEILENHRPSQPIIVESDGQDKITHSVIIRTPPVSVASSGTGILLQSTKIQSYQPTTSTSPRSQLSELGFFGIPLYIGDLGGALYPLGNLLSRVARFAVWAITIGAIDDEEVLDNYYTTELLYPELRHSHRQYNPSGEFSYELRVCPIVGLAQQNFTCAECRIPIGKEEEEGLEKVCLCDISGKYYCTKCYGNQEVESPARIINNWDFDKRRVAKETFHAIRGHFDTALIDLSEIGRPLYEKVPTLIQVRVLRTVFALAMEHVQFCNSGPYQEIVQQLSHKAHLIFTIELYTIQDLINVHDKSLLEVLQNFIDILIVHIKDECQSCLVRGRYCQLCKRPQSIFRFEVGNVVECFRCGMLSHKACAINTEGCPNCRRVYMSISSPSIEPASQIE